MERKNESFNFFQVPSKLDLSKSPSPVKIRFYAQKFNIETIVPNIKAWLKDEFNDLDVLSSILLSEIFNIGMLATKTTDIAVMLMREIETTREEYLDQFKRWTNYTRSSATKSLIIVFSNVSNEIAKERKSLYEKNIPNIIVEYFDIREWIGVKDEQKIAIQDYIKSFVLQFKEMEFIPQEGPPLLNHLSKRNLY